MGASVNTEEVEKNLKQFVEKQLPELLEKALEKACLIVENSAKQNCPVGDGQLRQSISHTVDKTKGEVGTNVEYAPYVEIGTGIYSTEGNGRQTPWTYQDAKGEWHTTRGMAAQPYLKPALDKNRSRIIDCFKGLI